MNEHVTKKMKTSLLKYVLLLAVVMVMCTACSDEVKETDTPQTNQNANNADSESQDNNNSGENPDDETEQSTATDYDLAENVAEGAILHCWNWSYNDIKLNMEEIAQDGF